MVPSTVDEYENQRMWYAKRVEITEFLTRKGHAVTETDIDQAMLAFMGESSTCPYKFKHPVRVMYPPAIIELSKQKYVSSSQVSVLQNNCRAVKKSMWGVFVINN